MSGEASPRRVSLLVGLAAFVSYAVTAARTINWWEGSQYPLAARTLGITSPPGSLLLTIYGWLISRIPFPPPAAFRLNLSAALLGAVAAATVTRLSIHLATPEGRRPGAPETVTGAIVGLAFALSADVWMNAIQFKPYILTAAFTAFILGAAAAWWARAARSDARRWLFLIFLLLGLDFSVHRTNALLLPAVLLWISLRRVRVWTRPGAWGTVLAGLALGLSSQLLLIPLSRRDPAFDLGQTRDLASLWSYVSLRQLGGSFLFRVLPRTSDFVRVQLADYAQFFRHNVLPAPGYLPLALPGIAALVCGWILAARGSARRFVGLLGFFACASVGAVIYFNLPEHYFRSMDRHYLPSLVALAPLAALGIAAVFRAAMRAQRAARFGWLAALGLLYGSLPVVLWTTNQRHCDLSRVRFAETYARDMIEPLPPKAILLTAGDNDTFPLWYLQEVEGVRRDVAVINIPLTNLENYRSRLRRRELRWIMPPPAGQPPRARTVPDTTVTIPVGAAMRAGLPPTAMTADSLRIRLSGLLLPQDFAALDLLRAASETRPVYVACTASPAQLPWLRPYLRLDGLALQVVASADPALRDLGRLRTQALERVRYTGVTDPGIEMDATSRAMCGNYLALLMALAQAQLEVGDHTGCLETLRFARAKTPPERLGQDPAALAALWSQAGGQGR